MLIPVYVQKPNLPPGEYFGVADDRLAAKEVARQVGVPDGSFLEGKIIRNLKNRPGPKAKPGSKQTRPRLPTHWSLVADVRFAHREK